MTPKAATFSQGALNHLARYKQDVLGIAEPDGIAVDLPTPVFEKIRSGATLIPLVEPVPLGEMAAVPWLSLCGLVDVDRIETGELLILTGPARHKKSAGISRSWNTSGRT